MGKKTHYPAYSTGSIVVNGQSVASTTKGQNGITSSYNMSEAEKDIYNKVQQGLSSSLSNLFEISDEKQKAWDSELETYKQKGLEQIDSIYTPMETNLKNDIASRFGNFDNSIFMDNLNQITDKKAQAVSDFSSDLLTKQSELYSDEMTNRMNYITLLSNLNSILNNNILSYTSAARSNAESGNNYNNQNFTANNQAALGWYNAGLNTIKTGVGSVAAFMA
ncbi:MAG: hypothetical protein NC191_03685 [Muribaculaceae bacterium]|nr:hypothetical protein [Muribaculaceae bacterium]